MFARFSLKAKLQGLCLLLTVFTIASGLLAYFNLQSVSQHYHHVAHTNLIRVQSAIEILARYRQMRIDTAQMSVVGIPKEISDASEADLYEFQKRGDQAFVDYQSVDYDPGMKFSPKEKELFEALQTRWNEFKERKQGLVKAIKEGDRKLVDHILNDVAPKTSAEFYASASAVIKFNEADSQAAVLAAEVASSRSNYLMAAIVAISVLCNLIIGYALAHSISKTLTRISSTLANEADQLGHTSNQIADASRSLSESTTEQAAALQETTASLEETSAMISKNADNAQRSTDVSNASQKSAQQGRETVEKMIHSINEITASNDRIMAQIDSSNREIADIVRVISDIGAKTKVINDIVFQTKLLSFNASVEAARAGEHGKGFAVVAEEVGNLAQMSGNAAKEISEMLSSSISTVERIIENTKTRVGALVVEGKQKVAAGTQTAQECGEMLQKIVAQVSDVGRMVSDISVASLEQARGVEEINKAMAQLDQSSQQNNSSTQTVSTSAGDLRHEVEELRTLVRELNTTIAGSRANSPMAATHAAPARVDVEEPSPAKNVLSFEKSARKSARTKTAEPSVPDQNDRRFKDV